MTFPLILCVQTLCSEAPMYPNANGSRIIYCQDAIFTIIYSHCPVFLGFYIPRILYFQDLMVPGSYIFQGPIVSMPLFSRAQYFQRLIFQGLISRVLYFQGPVSQGPIFSRSYIFRVLCFHCSIFLGAYNSMVLYSSFLYLEGPVL